MTIQEITKAASKGEARRMAIAFAQSNNYKVSAKHSEVKDAWIAEMTAIHANGKEGDYTNAILLWEVAETLATWI